MTALSAFLRFVFISDLFTLRGFLSFAGTMLGLSAGVAVWLQLGASEPMLVVSRELAFTCVDRDRFTRVANQSATLASYRDVTLSQDLEPWWSEIEKRDSLEGDEDSDEGAASLCWIAVGGTGRWQPAPRTFRIVSDEQIREEIVHSDFVPSPRFRSHDRLLPLSWFRENADRLYWPRSPALHLAAPIVLSDFDALKPEARRHALRAFWEVRKTANVVVVTNEGPKPAKFQLEIPADGVRALGGLYELREAWGLLAGAERELLPGHMTWSLVETSGGGLDPNSVRVLHDRALVPSPDAAKRALLLGAATLCVILVLNYAARRSTFIRL